MKTRFVSLLRQLALAGLLVGAPTVAFAEDFTINVRLQLSNLLDTAEPYVTCRVSADESFRDTLGAGQAEVRPDRNGNYSGSVAVKFNASAGKDPGRAKWYKCMLYVRAVSGVPFGGGGTRAQGPAFEEPAGGCPQDRRELCARRGTQFVNELTGRLDQAQPATLPLKR